MICFGYRWVAARRNLLGSLVVRPDGLAPAPVPHPDVGTGDGTEPEVLALQRTDILAVNVPQTVLHATAERPDPGLTPVPAQENVQTLSVPLPEEPKRLR